MNEKLPQPTDVLIKRLQRVAKWLDKQAAATEANDDLRARANTCWQCAGRLEELQKESR